MLFDNSFGEDVYHFDPDCGIRQLVEFYVFHCLNPSVESELSTALKNHSKILSFDCEKDVFYDKENDNYFTIWKMSPDSPSNITDYNNFCNKFIYS